jgi:hypothetical protein
VNNTKRLMIYVAGPLSKGNVALNIREALQTADLLWQLGFVPIVPHLTHFWNCMIPHEDTRYADSFWMMYDFAVLAHCDALFRIPGESIGADMEEQFCNDANIPVFYELGALRQWQNKGEYERF